MTAGRPRKAPRNLPEHIDFRKVPKGIYWDSTSPRWVIKEKREDGRLTTVRVASKDASMSDLHRIAEERQGRDFDSLAYLCKRFAESSQFEELSKSTQADYEYCRGALCNHVMRDRRTVGELAAQSITRPFVQRLVDNMAETPSKAAHVRRYLSRIWEWGLNRGHVRGDNPAKGIDMPTERKQRRLPDAAVMAAVIAYAGKQSVYLPHVAEIAYLCRLRGIEVVTLRESAASDVGLATNRRKGSRDNVVSWTPRLRAAWDALIEIRNSAWKRKSLPVPLRAEDRPLVVGQDGRALRKASLDTAWQRMITGALASGVITAEQRFSLHDLKRRGVTDTKGTRADKQDASGHRSAGMMDVYDLSLPVVSASDE